MTEAKIGRQADSLAAMSMDLEKGYTSASVQRSGVRERMQEIGEGEAHAVIRGDRDTLCGQLVRKRASWPPGSMEEPLCPQCAELAQELESADL